MPIHDQSYRRYGGRRESPRSAWTVIAVTGIKGFLAKRTFLLLLMAAWIPFVVRAVVFWGSVAFPQAGQLLGPKPETFRQFMEQQNLFVLLVAVYVGAGLIANDRRANALQIYLAKPLTRAEYVLGKMSILIVFLLLVTWVPGILLLITQGVFAGSFAFLRQYVFLVPAITLTSLLYALVTGFAMLALSSMSNSARFVGIMFFGVVFFSDAMFAALRGITGSTGMSWISFPATLAQLGDLIFRQRLRYDTPPVVSFIAVAAVIAVSMSVLDRKVRGVEVVT
jgi:ABC-2 type transport system permease protein